MAERGLSVDHTSIWRWTQAYAPEVYRKLQGELKRKSATWHMDETFVRIAGRWMYLFRAVDSSGQTVEFYLSETQDREAAKVFLKRALANPDNRPPGVDHEAQFEKVRFRRASDSAGPNAPKGQYPSGFISFVHSIDVAQPFRTARRRYSFNEVGSPLC